MVPGLCIGTLLSCARTLLAYWHTLVMRVPQSSRLFSIFSPAAAEANKHDTLRQEAPSNLSSHSCSSSHSTCSFQENTGMMETVSHQALAQRHASNGIANDDAFTVANSDQHQPQAARDTDSALDLVPLLLALQSVLPEAMVTAPDNSKRFSLKKIESAVQDLFQPVQAVHGSSSPARKESITSPPASHSQETGNGTAAHKGMQEGRVAMCLLMLNQWCAEVKQQGQSIPARAAAIISSVLATRTDQAAQGAHAQLSLSGLGSGLQRRASISSCADYLSWKGCDSEEDIDEEALEHAHMTHARPNQDGPLRSYQQEALDVLKQEGNYILASPTGSGKTRVAVELACTVLKKDINAKIVFLANTVALAEQQAEVFAAAACLRECSARVNCCTKGANMTPKKWQVAIRCDTVLVMTAQQLLNMLGSGAAALQQIQLLILDECHNCVGSSPYSQIMQLYRCMPMQAQGLTKVLGLTASPGVGINQDAAYRAQWKLKTDLCAEYHIVAQDDPEVKAHVGRATDRTVLWNPCAEDQRFAGSLAALLWSYVVDIGSLLPGVTDINVQRDLAAGQWAPELKSWFRTLLGPSNNLDPELTAYLKLLRDCNNTLAVASTTGYAVALQFLGKQCLEALTSTQNAGSAGSAAGSSGVEAANLVSVLVGDIADSVCKLPMAVTAVQASHNSASVTFPKFLELVNFLQDMVDKASTIHGIVFVTERQAVHALAGMLRGLPDLAEKANIHTFTGHPAKTKVQLAAEGASAGMQTQQQQAALLQFKQAAGREILIGTAAAEEGLDIVNCEFVVCYSVTQSGRQRIQRRGRARMAESLFLNIVEADSAEQAMLNKCAVEEESSRLAQLHF